MMYVQSVFFTVSGQRHSELFPGLQEDLDVFFVPGFQRNCTDEEN